MASMEDAAPRTTSHSICVTRPKGSLALRSDVFAFPGFDRRVTPTAAESASWRTSNSHGQYLSTDEIIQASPDAPDGTRIRERFLEPVRGGCIGGSGSPVSYQFPSV